MKIINNKKTQLKIIPSGDNYDVKKIFSLNSNMVEKLC